MRNKFLIHTYYGILQKIYFVELPDNTYGEWIIYENNNPKFHINLSRDNSTSDKSLKDLIENQKLSLEQIISKINLTQKRSLSFGKKPLFYYKKTSDLTEVDLTPLPTYYLIDFIASKQAKFPILQANQVAVLFTDKATGHILNMEFEVYIGLSDVYHIFESKNEALKFASSKIQENPEFEYSLMKEEGSALE